MHNQSRKPTSLRIEGKERDFLFAELSTHQNNINCSRLQTCESVQQGHRSTRNLELMTTEDSVSRIALERIFAANQQELALQTVAVPLGGAISSFRLW